MTNAEPRTMQRIGNLPMVGGGVLRVEEPLGWLQRVEPHRASVSCLLAPVAREWHQCDLLTAYSRSQYLASSGSFTSEVANFPGHLP